MLENDVPDNTSNDKDLTVIYVAGMVQQAHLLKNLLAERGIRAFVSNEVLAGGGVDVVGWGTKPHVAVAEEDAEEALRIADEFDRSVREAPALAADAEAGADAEEDDDWPLCPRCGARRPTRCPICDTTGTDFPRSDPDYMAASQLAAAAGQQACGCGSGGCSSHGEQAGEAEPHEAEAGDEPADESEAAPPQVMVTCTTCDEPFVPEYPRTCAWCGHEFEDGYACDDESQLMEPLTSRAIIVILVLLGAMAATIAYFQFVLY